MRHRVIKCRPYRVASALAAFGLALTGALPAEANSLRFMGDGTPGANRVMIQIDPDVPADVGAGDFTIEFWMKANAADNTPAPGESCDAAEKAWINGNIILDRAIFEHGLNGDFGLSMFRNGANSARLAFGVSKRNPAFGIGLCGSRNVADGAWHHVAITRVASSGLIRIFVDGQFDVEGFGPSNDISYRDGEPSQVPPGTPFNVDNYLGIGGEKYDADPTGNLGTSRFPSFSGFVDELRLSTVVRYPGTASFTPSASPFTPDAQTAALYHFDQASSGNCVQNTQIVDASNSNGSPGRCWFGGTPAGPVWSADSPFSAAPGPGTLQFSSAAQSVGEAAGTAAMGVTRSGGTDGAASVQCTSTPGIAQSPEDYTAISAQVLSWANGDGATKPCNVTIIDDATVEQNETFTLSLSNESGAALGAPVSLTVTISDNDSSPPPPGGGNTNSGGGGGRLDWWWLAVLASLLGGTRLRKSVGRWRAAPL
jgi:hypothetical protein